MTWAEQIAEQKAYYALCDKARALGIPTSLDDPRTTRTVAGLEAVVAVAEAQQSRTPDQMTDKELADALLAAQAAYRDHYPDEDEQEWLIWLENEVCDRANVPLDETEQGLSEKANAMIDAWIDAKAKED